MNGRTKDLRGQQRAEALVQEATAKLRQGRTSFIIAHRLSTIRNADTIVAMENGQIVEQGNHEHLLSQRGAYYELYTSQFTEAPRRGGLIWSEPTSRDQPIRDFLP